MTEREALKLALEALEDNYIIINGTDESIGLAGAMDGYYSGCFDVEGNNKLLIDAITAIKEVLAQPEQEPVAFIDNRIHGFPDCFVNQSEPPHTSPVYTTPPQHKPLTDEMGKRMKENYTSMEMRGAFADGWLSAEAAHGIKEKST